MARGRGGGGVLERVVALLGGNTGSEDPYNLKARAQGPCGVDLRSRRVVSALLVLFTALTTLFLVGQYEITRSMDGAPVGMHLGWQAFSTAFKTQTLSSSASGSDDTTPSDWDDDDDRVDYWDDWYGDDDDWWDEDEVPQAAAWDPLVPNAAPLTEITVQSCVIPPGVYDMCAPASTLRDDAERGPWVRVDKDLGKRAGLYYVYLYYRRLPSGSNAPVITNMTVLDHSPTAADLPFEDGGLWIEVSGNLRKGVWPNMKPLFLHYRLSPQEDVRKMREESPSGGAGILEPVTEMDVYYGGDAVRPYWGFAKLPHMVTGGTDDDKAIATGKGERVGTSIAIRKALKAKPAKPALRFSEDGRFRILQVADLHLSTGPGECRDMSPSVEAECKALGADRYSLELMVKMIAETKPDLIVLSGDQLNGQDTSWDSFSALMKYVPLLWDAKVPWTVIFGNHDGETDWDNARQMRALAKMPYFVGEAGPDEVDGVGNYVRAVRSADSSNTTLLNLYFFDSHSLASSLNPFDKGYDWLKANQINFFRSKSSEATPIMRPWSPPRGAAAGSNRLSASATTPAAAAENEGEPAGLSAAVEPYDADADPFAAGAEALNDRRRMRRAPQGDDEGDLFASIEDDSWGEPTVLPAGPTKSKPMKAKPNAMVFFHIPLPESYDAAIDVAQDGKRLVVGDAYDGKGSPSYNSGFFEDALLAQGELVDDNGGNEERPEFWDGEFSAPTSGRPEVKVVANGHCHITDNCRRVSGVWLCFDGGSSYSGYGQSGFARRFRVFDVADYGETIKTFKLLDTLEKIDDIVLVGEGAWT